MKRPDLVRKHTRILEDEGDTDAPRPARSDAASGHAAPPLRGVRQGAGAVPGPGVLGGVLPDQACLTMPDPETTLNAIRDWLERDTLRRAGEKDPPYSRGFDDGWDAAREEVGRLLGQEVNAETAH